MITIIIDTERGIADSQSNKDLTKEDIALAHELIDELLKSKTITQKPIYHNR